MAKYEVSKGEGRTRVGLTANSMGSDVLVSIYNENAHVGAVAVGEYDSKQGRASVSVITRLGHKDDAIARQAAYLISKSSQKTVCVIAGIHLDDITQEEIDKILENAETVVEEFVKSGLTGL